MQLYFIAVVLPAELDLKILAFKNWMATKYNCRVALKSPAHITIVPPFWLAEEKESDITSDVKSVAAQTPAFMLETNNFSAFKPRTLFAALAPNEQLSALKKRSDEYFNSPGYKIKAENRPFHPHITIATRDLQKNDFAEAWQHFANKSFEEKFEADGLSILKHNGHLWELFFTANFLNP